MSRNYEAYRHLQQDIAEARLRGQLTEDDEDEFADQINELWTALTDDERNAVRATHRQARLAGSPATAGYVDEEILEVKRRSPRRQL